MPQPWSKTHIGFQTDNGNPFNNDTDWKNYLNGLNYGVTFGAEYEEVFPQDVYSYLTYVPVIPPAGDSLSNRMMNFQQVQHALIVNVPSNQPNCQPQ